MLDQLRTGDIFVVWKLDRLSRSFKDLLHIMEKIESVGAGFRLAITHIFNQSQGRCSYGFDLCLSPISSLEVEALKLPSTEGHALEES